MLSFAMETAKITKDIALLAISIAATLIPWFLDKVGFTVPRWGIGLLGVCIIGTMAWGVSNLVSIVLPESMRQPRVSLVKVGFLLLAIMVALLSWSLTGSPARLTQEEW